MNLVIVIVTYNRLEKLQKTLDCYQNQTAVFNSIVVVDNCSTDGTIEFLKSWQLKDAEYSKYVIYKKENSGGSGGFYEGQKFALTLNPDWIYVSDDDAYPECDMVKKFMGISETIDINTVSAICTTVYSNNERIDFDHRKTYVLRNGYKFIKNSSQPSNYEKKFFKIHMLSYVGSFLNVLALKKVGLCNPKLFIYYDDTEHSLRLLKYGNIYCYPELKVLHDSGFDSVRSDNVLYTWRDYYNIRNYVNMLKKHHVASAIYTTAQYIYNTIITNRVKFILVIHALFDAWFNRLGKHRIYKPGFTKTN